MSDPLENILAIAKKYYQWSYPIIEPDILDEFRKAVRQEPSFDGKTKDVKLAAKLSYDSALMGVNGIPNATLALACVVFDMAPTAVWAAQNLGCAIAMFCDNNDDDAVHAREAEIYADAETVLKYAVLLSMKNGSHGANSADPLVCLGNLQLDMHMDEAAEETFSAAIACGGSAGSVGGLRSYCKAKGNTDMLRSLSELENQRPTTTQRAFKAMEEDLNKAVPSRYGPRETEAELERNMDELAEVKAVTFADLLGPIDPATAAKMRADAEMAGGKMKFTVPNTNILTQYTTISEDNKVSVWAAINAVGNDHANLAPYVEKYISAMSHMNADIYDNIGVDTHIGSMDYSDFMRQYADDPSKLQGKDMTVDPNMITEIMNKMSEQMKVMMQKAEAMNLSQEGMEEMLSQGFMTDEMKDFYNESAKIDAATGIYALDPFEYANPWDVLLQKWNASLLEEKTEALLTYIGMINNKVADGLKEIADNYSLKYSQIYEAEAAEYSRIEALLNAEKISSEEKDILVHKIHTTYYPQRNALTKPRFGQATQLTAMAYKKLEKYIPKMYQSAMRHLMLISDEKVREQKEAILVGAIANALQTAMGNILSAYGIGMEMLNVIECGCDEELLASYQKTIDAKRKAEGDAAVLKQKAIKDAFKSGEIDENSSFYKNFIKKYEYTIDFGFMKYKSNLHLSTSSVTLWTPFGSIDHSSYKNHMTGRSGVSADLTLSLGEEIDPLKGEAKFGFSISRDKNGKVHPRDVDIRASLEVGTNLPYLSASAGMSASLMRGTKIYGGASASTGHIDDYKERLGTMGNYIPVSSPTLELWSGEYNITDRN
ncbi:MAG: hypothetical protein FWH44_04665 [Methanomassiliicoccaceae archaeon]|nr:hypothetical protein [Methanomassiliicoccaceae archaeon]